MGKSHVVEIKRMTSGVTITSINLKEWNGSKEGNYTYVVRSSMNTYDPDGKLVGDPVNYSPRAAFQQNGYFSAPIFYTFPTEKFIVDIYYNGELIYTCDEDADGNPFVPQVGRTLNIIIIFSSELNIITEVTPWNVVYQYVEYK